VIDEPGFDFEADHEAMVRELAGARDPAEVDDLVVQPPAKANEVLLAEPDAVDFLAHAGFASGQPTDGSLAATPGWYDS
jgi:hypothetical protein